MIQKESIKIIDGEEYVNSEETLSLIKAKSLGALKTLIIEQKIQFIEHKNRIWVKQSSLYKYLNYKEEKDKIQKYFSEKRNIFKLEEKKCKEQKEKLDNNYYKANIDNFNYFTMPNSKLLYNPHLFIKLDSFDFLASIKKHLIRDGVFFIGDIRKNADAVLSHAGDLYSRQLLYILSLYKISFKEYNVYEYNRKFYWSNSKIQLPVLPFELEKISDYISQREQEQVEIENLIRANNPSKSLTPLD